jgi:hypothetical protein
MRLWFKKLLLAMIPVMGIAAALLAAEEILRVRNPDYLREFSIDNMNYMHTYSRIYGWKIQKGTMRGGVTVNSKRYRGREYGYSKPGGQTRVVLLGDSITFGCEVADDETFAARLDSARGDVEVVNLAVQGYGTDQALIRLEREGFRYDPDIVVLGFCMANDFQDNLMSTFLYDRRYPKPYYRLEGGELVLQDRHLRFSVLKTWAFMLTQKSILYNRLLRTAGIDRDEHARALAPEEVLFPYDTEITFRLIRRMHDLCSERGVRFAVLLFPDKELLERGDPAAIGEMFRSPALDGVRLVNLADHYGRAGLNSASYDVYVQDRTFHLTPAGHQLTADILERILVEDGWLSRRAGADAAARD